MTNAHASMASCCLCIVSVSRPIAIWSIVALVALLLAVTQCVDFSVGSIHSFWRRVMMMRCSTAISFGRKVATAVWVLLLFVHHIIGGIVVQMSPPLNLKGAGTVAFMVIWLPCSSSSSCPQAIAETNFMVTDSLRTDVRITFCFVASKDVVICR